MGRRYRIGQASEMLGLNSSVLRFWETEFPQLEPLRTRKGQRLYSDETLALLERIRVMLHEEGLTIEGARKRLESQEADAQVDAQAEAVGEARLDAPGEGATQGTDLKREMVEELLALKRLLGK